LKMMERRFVVDTTVGKLAKWLRGLGFDTTLFPGRDLHRLVQIALEEDRTILTRNRALEAKLFLGNIFIVRENKPELQVAAVLQGLGLEVDPGKFLCRCLLCNSPLEEVSRDDVEGRVPEYVYHTHRVFRQCPSCGRIYWEGTHPARMREKIKNILDSAGIQPASVSTTDLG